MGSTEIWNVPVDDPVDEQTGGLQRRQDVPGPRVAGQVPGGLRCEGGLGGGCVLDVYLYPPESGSGSARVTHADARRTSGADIDVASCLALMGR